MTARRTPEEIEALWLRASALRRRMEELPGKLNDWVVLSHGGDPAQITRARFDNALWLSDWWVRAKLRMGIGDIHTRGMHYALFGEIRPNGETYGTRQDWRWLKKTSGDARWYGLIPWTEIIDQKNDTPFVWTPNPAQPSATVVADYDFYLPTLEDLTPTVALGANGRDGENGIDRGGLIPEQPYRIAMIGEKTSLRRILLPLAQRNNADLVLFSGDGSNTLLYDMLRRAAEDGRLLVVLYFSDADPSGWDMVPSVSYKLAAIRDINFPEVEFITHRVGLTPYQVMAYNSDHPDAPLPEAPDPEEDEETDKVNGQKVRRDRWRDRWNIGQIEIDALMTRDPDLLTEMAENAILSFHDEGLAARTLRVQGRWLADCKQAVEDQEGPEQAQLRQEVADRLAEMSDEAAELIESVQVDLDGFNLPDQPDLPEAEVHPEHMEQNVLMDSRWPFHEQLLRLKASRAYTPWQDEGRVR